VAADDGQRFARSDDARARHDAVADRVAQSVDRQTRSAEVAHRCEPRARGQQCVLDPDDRGELVGIDRPAPERRSRIAGQMDVGIDQPGHHGAAAHVDHGRSGRRRCARLDAADAAVLDDHRRGPERRLGRVDDQPPRLYRERLGRGRRRGQQRDRRENDAFHDAPPVARP
jgi:hypothetical protein